MGTENWLPPVSVGEGKRDRSTGARIRNNTQKQKIVKIGMLIDYNTTDGKYEQKMIRIP